MSEKRYCLLIGNSRWHWAEKQSNSWNFFDREPNLEILQSLDSSYIKWAAVGQIPLNTALNSVNRLTIKDIPLIKLPPWLGIDRALVGWGAFQKANASNQNSEGLLVADAGTVLSLTRIAPNGEFTGGQLVAGLRLQMAAMNYGTQNLNNPGIDGASNTPSFPIATAQAMQRGSIQALIGTIIEAQKTTQLPLWLCGGDAPLLMKELEKKNVNVIHHPHLAMEAMVEIHELSQA